MGRHAKHVLRGGRDLRMFIIEKWPQLLDNRVESALNLSCFTKLSKKKWRDIIISDFFPREGITKSYTPSNKMNNQHGHGVCWMSTYRKKTAYCEEHTCIQSWPRNSAVGRQTILVPLKWDPALFRDSAVQHAYIVRYRTITGWGIVCIAATLNSGDRIKVDQSSPEND